MRAKCYITSYIFLTFAPQIWKMDRRPSVYRQTMWFTNKILRRIACFRHTQKIGLLAIIYNSFFSSFWSVCKTFFRGKSTNILARSISFFSSFLFSSQYNEQDHITSITNTVMDILYRQTVIYQQCIYIEIWEESYVFADIQKKLAARNLVYIFSSFQRVIIQ